jgi:hypothetical protein
MNLFSRQVLFSPARTSIPRTQDIATELRHLPQHALCVGLGLVGGSAGTALTIFAAIVVQILLVPPTTFGPGVIPLTLVSAGLGLGVAWLLARLGYGIIPSLPRIPPARGLHLILICSVLGSLVQNLFFAYGL